MLVSVILCTYNRAPLLPRAINSVLKQTYGKWELVIVDDGSNDATRSLVKRFMQRDQRISYIFQPNAGLATARNTGIRFAKGDFLCFVDSDDELAPLHLEKRVTFMKRAGNVDFLHGGIRLIGERKKHYVADLNNPGKKIHLSKCHVGGTFFFQKEYFAAGKNIPRNSFRRRF